MDANVQMLVMLSNASEDRARKMLEHTGGNVERAMNLLLDDYKIPDISAPAPSPTGDPPAYGPPNQTKSIGWITDDCRPATSEVGSVEGWTDTGRSRARESAPPPQRQEGDKNNPIDVDSQASAPNGDDDLARAMAMSLQDHNSGEEDLRRATELSLADQHDASAGDWDTQPPAKRIRLEMSAPVILRASTPLATALPPILQALFASEPVREAILALDLGHVPHQDGQAYTLDGYWRGVTCWAPGKAISDEARAQGILMALQRLFIVMERTRRSTVQISDLEAWLRPFAKDAGSNPIDAGRIYLDVITNALLFCCRQELQEVETGVDVDSLIETKEERTTAMLRIIRSIASKISSAEIVAELGFAAMSARGYGDERPSVHASLEAFLSVDQSIDEPADSGIFLLLPKATAPGQLRRPVQLDRQLWLDRYTTSDHVGPARAQAAQLASELKEVEASIAKLGDPVEADEAFSSLIEYYKEHADAGDDDEAGRKEDVAAMLKLVETSQQTYREHRARLSARSDAILKERRSLFDTDELKQVGPYELVAITVWAGMMGRDYIFAFVRHGEQWYRVGAENNMPTSTPVTWETIEGERAGVHLSGGSYGLFYARQQRQALPRASFAAIEAAVDADNRTFAAELPETLTADWHLPKELTEDMSVSTETSQLLDAPNEEPDLRVEPMSVDSHSPVAPTSLIDLDDSTRLRGGSINGHVEPEEDDDDSDEYGSDVDEEDPEVDLGVVKPIRKPLQVASMNGKVGGRPMWLNADAPLMPSNLICGVCHGKIGATGDGIDEALPMRFLLQVNAPAPDQPDAYRAIYIFACHREACVLAEPSKAIKILRCQLPDDNPYYSYDAETDRVQVIKPANEDQLCQICGLLGDRACERCSQARYCSRRCLELARPSHAAVCGQDEVADSQRQSSQSRLRTARGTIAWREGALDVEPEPERQTDDDPLLSLKGLTVQPPAPESLDAKEPETKSAVDKAFMRFHERVQREPRQVLRYYRHAEIPDEPLWVSDAGKPTTVPPCSLCTAERTCEMQILSTLISHLGVDDTVEGSFDFGTLLVYTCSASCDLASGQWAEEVVRHQSFSSDGVDLGQRRPA